MLKILKILQLNTFKSIELLKVEEELTELMVELVHIFHPKLTFKCGLPKKSLMLEEKVKPDKSLKEKFQLENLNDFLALI